MAANIKIKNFQSIQSADIVVDGFTILVGESSQGKSACLRAVNAACNNKFRQNYLRYGAEEMSVTIGYDNEGDFQATKVGDKSPTYRYNEQRYEKLNRTVPEEIQTFNNFGVIDYYEQKYPLNFFSQFSKPLLLEFSQKRILEILSSSKAYDDMNKASSNLNKHKEQNSGAFKQVSAMLDDNRARLSVLKAELEVVEPKALKLKEHMDMLDALQKRMDGLTALEGELSALETTKANIKLREPIIESIETYRQLINTSSKIDILQKELAVDSAARMRVLEDRIGMCERVFALQDEKTAVRTDLVNALIGDLDAHTAAKERLAKLAVLKNKCEYVLDKLREHVALEAKNDKISMLLVDIDARKRSLQSIQEKERLITEHICPVCGNKLNF